MKEGCRKVPFFLFGDVKILIIGDVDVAIPVVGLE